MRNQLAIYIGIMLRAGEALAHANGGGPSEPISNVAVCDQGGFTASKVRNSAASDNVFDIDAFPYASSKEVEMHVIEASGVYISSENGKKIGVSFMLPTDTTTRIIVKNQPGGAEKRLVIAFFDRENSSCRIDLTGDLE